MPERDPPITPRELGNYKTEQILWRMEDTHDGCVALRAVPWWHVRAYVTFPVIASAMLGTSFVWVWWSGITTEPVPWWWVAGAVVLGAYWPIERAYVQNRARVLFPIVLKPSTGEVGIEGERFEMASFEAIEHVVVLRDARSEGGPFRYHEIHAIVGTESGRRRIVLVEEGLNGAAIAAELAKLIECELRKVEVAEPK